MGNEVDARRVELRAERRRRNRRRGRPSITVLRIAELSRFFVHRYGAELPDDDAGRDDAAILLHHLVQLVGDPVARATAWANTRAPWLQGDELAAAIDAALASRRSHKANELGALLGLTDVERTKLAIRTIGPCDMTRRQRTIRCKERKREADRQRRRDRGALPRSEYERKAAERARPWNAEGLSRRQWYRNAARQRDINARQTDGTGPRIV